MKPARRTLWVTPLVAGCCYLWVAQPTATAWILAAFVTVAMVTLTIGAILRALGMIPRRRAPQMRNARGFATAGARATNVSPLEDQHRNPNHAA